MYKFNFIDERMLNSMVSIVFVLYEPITVYMAGRLYCAAFSNVHHDPASVPHLPVRPVAAEADREADVAHVLHRM